MSQGVSVVGDDLDNIFYGDEPDEPALPRKKVESICSSGRLFASGVLLYFTQFCRLELYSSLSLSLSLSLAVVCLEFFSFWSVDLL
jgi:hypothetical protein